MSAEDRFAILDVIGVCAHAWDTHDPDGWVSCAYLSGGRVDVMPRFHRHPRMYDRYDRGPSVEFNFGFGGPSMHVRPRPMYPWWY